MGINITRQIGYSSNKAISLWVDGATSASYAETASLLLGTIESASYAVTASYALNAGSGGSSSISSVTLTAGEIVSQSKAGYVSSDGKIYKTDASNLLSSGPVLAGIILNNAGVDESCELQFSGQFSTSSLSSGSIYYLSEQSGSITTTAPSSNGSIIRVLGYAVSNTQLIVKPDSTWVENGYDTVAINTQTGTTYTFALTDIDTYCRFNNASAIVATIPSSSVLEFPTGSVIPAAVQVAGGTLTISGSVGVTINGNEELGGGESAVVSAGSYKAMALTHISLDNWEILGGA
jgi:hypothetical protein